MSTISHIRRHWAVFLGLFIALAVWCAVDVSRRAQVDRLRPGLHKTDVTVYIEAGRAFFDGRDPYEVANIRGWKYLYPPLFALLISPLANLTEPWQATVWFAISLLMCFGIYFECRRLLKHILAAEETRTQGESRLNVPVWISIAAAGTTVLPALNCLQRGQMGIALLYPLLLGFRLIVAGRSRRGWLVGGMILALPVALKLTPLLPVACILFVCILTAGSTAIRRPTLDQGGPQTRLPQRAVWSTAGCLAGSALFFLLLPASLVGWDKNLHYLETWHEKVATKVNDVRTNDFGENVDSPRNQSLANAAYRFGNWAAYEFAGGPFDAKTGKEHGSMPMDAPLASQMLLVLRCLALVILLLVAIRAGLSASPLLGGVALGLSSVATLVVSPVARGHYFVLFLPAALFVPLWFIKCGAPRRAFRAAVVPALLVVAHYALLEYTGRVGLLGIGTTLWYFAASTQIAFGRTAVTPSVDQVNTPLALPRAA
jgi:hypothetical protein